MFDHDDEMKWDGYDHLMNAKPNTKYDPKASIYDIHSMRDSVLFEKERFSFCLSPPKEDPKTFKFPKKNGGGGALPPTQQNQQHHHLNTRKLPPQISNPISIPSQPIRSLSTQPNSPIKSLSSISQSPKRISTTTTSLSKISSSPTTTTKLNKPTPISISKKDDNSTTTKNLTIRPPTPTKLTSRPPTPTSSSSLSSSLNSTSNNNNSAFSSSLNNNNTLTTRPPTPTKLNMGDLTTPSRALNKSLNASISANTAAVNSIVDTDPINMITEAKFESRFKSMEMENKILRQQIDEKENSIQQLTHRVSELEFQLANFMLEVKMVLMNSDLNSSQSQ
eukprot:gene653-808_t